MDKYIIHMSKPGNVETVPKLSTSSSATSKTSVSGSSRPIMKTSQESKSIIIIDKITGKGGRTFQKHWINTYSWLHYEPAENKVFCSICKEATLIKAPLPLVTMGDRESYSAFVENGFCTWGIALRRFKSHEKGNLHRAATLAISSIKKGINVVASLSSAKIKEMKDARTALLKIISLIQFLGMQGLALRGHSAENSNFYQLIKLRSEDVPELKSWLTRTKYKWISHDIINEILSLLATNVLHKLIQFIKKSECFSLIVDETSDISIKEQVSLSFRVVDDNLVIDELFCGFYHAPSTNSETLFAIIKDVLLRFGLPLSSCCGQCYDGASNVSGHLSGLQARVKMEESRALFVHCTAHTLNLVVQDSMQNINIIRDILALLRDLITFVRGSPKRLEIFSSLQSQSETSNQETTKRLSPFCPTRWCLRIISLKCLEKNYEALLIFLDEMHKTEKNDAGAKAKGFLTKLLEFETLFLIKCLIAVFERIEILNCELQKVSLNFHISKCKIDNITQSLELIRESGFHMIWDETNSKASNLSEMDPPSLPRQRKVPTRYAEGSTSYQFETPADKYRQIYKEILDVTLTSLKSRFQPEVLKHLERMEQFAIGNEDVTFLISFYGKDFDPERLTLHRNIFLDVAKKSNILISNFLDVYNYFSSKESSRLALKDIVSEYIKFVKLVLTIPVSTCTAERSFSGLRRLKTELRSTVTQERLNHMAILHIHREMTGDINIDTIADDFINKSSVRRNTFKISLSSPPECQPSKP